MSRSYAPSSLYVAPTLVIGLGGSGVAVIRQLKSRIRQAVRQVPGIIEFLAVDTEPIENMPGDERIFDREIAYLGDYNAQRVISSLDRHPHIKDWWFTNQRSIIGRVFRGARQRRAVGRLSLYARWGHFAKRLDAKLLKVREIAEKELVEQRGMQVDRTGQVRVYIVSSLCGGTGAGTFLDVAFRVRKKMGDDAEIVGLFVMPSVFLPDVQSRIQQQRIQGNAYAALRELNHFLSGAPFDSCFPDDSFYKGDGVTKASVTLRYPFNTVYLVDRDNGRESLSSIAAVRQMMAQFLYLDIITPIGKDVAAKRENLNDLASEVRENETLAIAGFVTASLVTPSTITEMVSNLYRTDFVSRRLIGPDIEGWRAQIQAAVQEFVERLRREINAATATTGGGAVEGDDLAALFGLSTPKDPSDVSAAQLSDSERRRALFDALRQQIDDVFRRYGLAAVVEFLTQLSRSVIRYRNELDQQVKSARSSRQGLDAAPLTQKEKGFGALMQVVRNTFASDDVDAEKQSRATRIADLRAEEGQYATRLDFVSGLLNDIETIQTSTASVLEWLKLLTPEEPILTYSDSDDARNESDAMLFDLVTSIGQEREILAPGRVTDQEMLIRRYLRSRQVLEGPLAAREGELLNRMHEYLLQLKITDIDGRLMMRVTGLPGERETVLEVRRQIEVYVSNNLSNLEDIGVSDYLTWFYRTIQYTSRNSTISRNSPIDPVLRLKRRCERPFLRVDESQLGTEHAFDMEPVKLVGTSPLALQQDWQHHQPDHLLADFDDFLPIDTGTPDRLDVLFASFGYKISDLADLEDFGKSYRYFMENVRESLHIHQDWPDTSKMVDPLSLRTRAVGRAASSLPPSSAVGTVTGPANQP